jgi:hypothetical protein
MPLQELKPEEHVLEEALRRADLDLPVPVEPEEPQLAGHHVGDLVAVSGSSGTTADLVSSQINHFEGNRSLNWTLSLAIVWEH